MMTKYVLLIALILTSCSEDGNFIDKPLSGLNYRCSSGHIGKTDMNGKYECKSGDSVTFSIGATEISVVNYTDNNIITSEALFSNKLEASNFIKDIQSLDVDTYKHNILITPTLEQKLNTNNTITQESTKNTTEKEEHKIKEEPATTEDDTITVIKDEYPSYRYRAWGMGGDSLNSQASIQLNGKVYTALAFSKKNLTQLESSTAGDVTTIIVNIEKNGIIKELKITISQDYLDSDIVLKIYNSQSLFNYETLQGFSTQNHLGDSGTYVDFGIINL